MLGINVIVNQDDLHLFRDYKSDEVCWEYENEDFLIKINANDGRLVNFALLGKSVESCTYSENVLRELNIIDGYELASVETVDGGEVIEYARKYGEIFNYYQSATIAIKNGKIFNIFTSNCEYEDKEVLVSKEEALKILNDNGIDVDDVELAIENVGVFTDNNPDEIREELSEENIDSYEFNRKPKDIRKVWKTKYLKNVSCFIDSNTGEYIKCDSITDE